jgi:glycosyltransferase involved in cell wall biosynthesis
LKRQLDWDLLEGLVVSRPQWSLVLVGPLKSEHPEIAERLARLEKRPNVFWLGHKPADALPGYLQHVDVSLLPYRRTAYTDCIYPMKLHESLAAGTPVVGTPIRTLRDFAGLIGLATTPGSMAEAVATALAGAHNQTARAARRETAMRHDWDVLTARIAREMAGLVGADTQLRVEEEAPPGSDTTRWTGDPAS